jgi:RND family efflux transporter MFP subunit
MRKLLVFIVLAACAGGYFIYHRTSGSAADPSTADPARDARPGMPGGPGGGAFARPPMTVETAAASRAPLTEHIMIVGNLIGEATVEVVPKVGGRLERVSVRLGDAVTRGQHIAKIEDFEIQEQVKQAQASYEVAAATVRQREADLKFSETNLERSRNLYGRQLLPRQALDDAEATHQASAAQLDLARAQFAQAGARLNELKITLTNTQIVSPVNGFVGKRYLDPGGFASTNAPIVSVVDISLVRLVANVVERDLRRVKAGIPARVEVDAYPGESFDGRIARVAPVLDPATRTAEIEVEVPNPGFRLRPGMYARVRLEVATNANALVVPRNAIVDVEGKRGVFVPAGETAKFVALETGIQDDRSVEVLTGIKDGDTVVTTGAGALRDGDRIMLAGQRPRSGGPGASPDPGRPGRRGPL